MRVFLVLALLSFNAYAATAYLVRTYPATSVTGQAGVVCVYSYNGQEIERMFSGALCPPSIQVQ